MENPLKSCTDQELIEMMEAVNAEYPGRSELLVRWTKHCFLGHARLTTFIGMGCIVGEELANRLKAIHGTVA